MYSRVNISLIHHVFDPELIFKEPDEIIEIFRKSIPSNFKFSPRLLLERTRCILKTPLARGEKDLVLKRIVVTFPHLFLSTLQSLESKIIGKYLLEHLLGQSEKPVLLELLRSFDEDSFFLFLTAQKFYALEMILLKKDLDVFKEISPRPLFRALKQAVDQGLEHMLIYLDYPRLINLPQLFHPCLIESTLELFLEILEKYPQKAACIYSVMNTQKERFAQAYLVLLLTKPDSHLLLDRHYLYQRPDLLEAKECTLRLLKNDLLCEEWLEVSEETLLTLLSLPKLLNLLLPQKKTQLVEYLSIRLAKADILLEKNRYDRVLLLDFYFSLSISDKRLISFFPALEHDIKRISQWKEQKDYSLKRFEEVFSQKERLSESLLTFFCEMSFFEDPGLKIENLQIYDKETLIHLLPILEPSQIKYVSNYLPREYLQMRCENIKIFSFETGSSFSFPQVLTEFYLNCFFELRQQLGSEIENFDSSIHLLFLNSLGHAPAIAFFTGLSYPTLRSYIVDLIGFLDSKILKMIIPVLNYHELHKIFQKHSLEDILNFTPFLTPDQATIFTEFLGPYLLKVNKMLLNSNYVALQMQKSTLTKLEKTISSKTLEAYLLNINQSLQQFLEIDGENMSEEILCPITRDAPVIPVKIRTCQGTDEKFIYDKEALLSWLRKENTSPMTRAEVLEVISLIPDMDGTTVIQTSGKIEQFMTKIISLFGYAVRKFRSYDSFFS